MEDINRSTDVFTNLLLLFSLGLHLEMCLNNVVSILNRAYVKKTDDINRVNRARSHPDGE